MAKGEVDSHAIWQIAGIGNSSRTADDGEMDRMFLE